MPKKNFKSKVAYKKYLAYKHIHIGPSKHPFAVTIAGKPHRVSHKDKRGDEFGSPARSQTAKLKRLAEK